MSRPRIIGRAALVMGALATGALLAVLLGSLRPSIKANALYSQGRFQASEFEDLTPGEVRFVEAGLGAFYVVVPTDELWADLDVAAGMAVNRHYDTFDEELGAFVLWSIAPNRRGIRCSVLIVDKTPGGDGAERVGGFFDPCYGAQFDFAGRVLLSPANYSAPLKRVRYERVNGDVYQITNPDYLMRAWR